MKTLREQLKGKCKHFSGFPHGHNTIEAVCKAGINYYRLVRYVELGSFGCACRIPCTGALPGSQVNTQTVETCNQYEALTEEEIQAEVDHHERFIDCLNRRVSLCCEADIDESHVIAHGEHKGHGPRYCKKCGQLLFMV